MSSQSRRTFLRWRMIVRVQAAKSHGRLASLQSPLCDLLRIGQRAPPEAYWAVARGMAAGSPPPRASSARPGSGQQPLELRGLGHRLLAGEVLADVGRGAAADRLAA